MFIEEIEAKELLIAKLISDLNSYKYIDIDFRPCEISDGSRSERLEIKGFQLLESIDGHILYLELIAYDGEDFCFSIPDIAEVVSVKKIKPGKLVYKLKSHVRLFARFQLDLAYASLQVAAANSEETLLLKEIGQKLMYMTHVFTLSNE